MEDLQLQLNGKPVWLIKSSDQDSSGSSCDQCVYDFNELPGQPSACPRNEGYSLKCVMDANLVQHFTDIDPSNTSVLSAPNLLKRASDLMIERAVQYDSPEGERSMEKIVNSFNALTGKELTEAQGWMFMVLLKLVRDNTRVVGHKDSCDDLIAYAALYGESRLNDN